MTSLIVDNYHRIPNEFWDIDLTAAERVVLHYIARHTYGYGEELKQITVDEFQYGRKRADGSRLDAGTGLARGTISGALNRLEERNLITVVVDARDLGRVRKYYGLVIQGSMIEYRVQGMKATSTERTRTEKHTLLKEKEKNNAAAVHADEVIYDETVAGETSHDALTQNLNDGQEALPPTAAEPPSPAAAKLLAFGVHEEMARTLADQHSAGQIDAAIAEARRSADRNPPGFVVDALRGGWVVVNKFIHDTPDQTTETDEQTAPPASLEQTTEVDLRDDETQTCPCAAEQDDYWRLCQNPPTGEWATPTGQWHAAYLQLKAMLDRPTFEGVLKGARLLEVVANTWRIEVRTAYAQQLLQGRLYRGIRRVVRDIHGDPVELEFIEQGSTPAATQASALDLSARLS